MRRFMHQHGERVLPRPDPDDGGHVTNRARDGVPLPQPVRPGNAGGDEQPLERDRREREPDAENRQLADHGGIERGLPVLDRLVGIDIGGDGQQRHDGTWRGCS